MTNQYDHMLLLNDDHTCAYRGFDSEYLSYELLYDGFKDDEFNAIEHYPRRGFWYSDGRSSNKNPKFVPDIEKAWYCLDKENLKLIGPFFKTNSCDATEVHVNRFSHWEMMSRCRINKSSDTLGYIQAKCPCHVKVLNIPRIGAKHSFEFHLGKDSQGIFLWLPTMWNYDITGPEIIVFRKQASVSQR